ncbi:uncharacterized protein LOC101857465 isoform X1 [Aplysia californica]|uniref:Uncharacterized protein LOC101857465 isoform X1 n=1 Tax=Aplysia californica TaxID=6500 RepID=A0ABM1AFT9_APLCA|nr:uncharacterized protein LOC101857465 isoform X1 [Aplysia californica]
MTQKVKLKANLSDEDTELLTLERMRSDLSFDSGIGTGTFDDSRRPSLTRENTTLSMNEALLRESSSSSLTSDATAASRSAGDRDKPGNRDTLSGRANKRKTRSFNKKKQVDFFDKDLRKISIGETLEEEEEDETDGAPTTKELRLAREDSLLYFRKPSGWLHGKELTPSLLRDLEKTATMSRYAELLLPDYLQSREDEAPITPEPKKGPEYTEEQLKNLTPWERWLLGRKPIIAPDGYIPNSVVRAQIGYIKPETPRDSWKLKPVPESDPRHLPEGYKPMRERSYNRSERDSVSEEPDLNNIMTMRNQSTVQRVKIQQSIKEASLYIGTSMCLLPDGTEPEGVPTFAWRSDKEQVADLTPLPRPRTEDNTPVKEVSFVTPVPVKVTPSQESPGGIKLDFKTQSKPLRKVDIDLGGGLSLEVGAHRGPPRVGKMPPPLDMEKSKSFRLSQAVSETPLELPIEESERGTEEQSNPSPTPTDTSAATTATTATTQSKRTAGEKKTNKVKEGKHPVVRERSNIRKPMAPPPKKLTKEEELSLLQKIVREEWFPPGVPPLLELVNDELSKLLDVTDTKIFTAVCDSLVQIYQELSIAPKFLTRASDKLTKQLTSPSAITRKKAVWTLKQLGLQQTQARKDILASLLPSLLDDKDDRRQELVQTLSELMGGSSSKEGLQTMMSSLGISRPINTKEEQVHDLDIISAAESQRYLCVYVCMFLCACMSEGEREGGNVLQSITTGK